MDDTMKLFCDLKVILWIHKRPGLIYLFIAIWEINVSNNIKIIIRNMIMIPENQNYEVLRRKIPKWPLDSPSLAHYDVRSKQLKKL